MKKTIFSVLVTVLLLALALPMAAVSAHTESSPQVQTLYAGQNIDVGSVNVWNDGTNLYVTYEITDPDWRITETHLYVGENNPNTLTTAPGQFPYDDDDAASITDTVVSYVIPLAEIDSYSMQLNKKGKPTGVMVADGTPGVEPCNNIYIAAHAVVDTYPLCQSQGIVYGTEQVSGYLYQIDVVGGTATMIADITDPAPANDNSPNGLAFDPVSGRLYFSAVQSNSATTSDLYFWDGITITSSGTVPGIVAGATFYNQEYYYVYNSTDDLKKVTFDGSGMVSAVLDVNIGFADPDTFRFGDIVIDPSGPTLYGSSVQSGGTPPTFFSIAPLSGTYTQLSTTDGLKLQLAYGSNGLLYGQSTGTGEFFVVDPSSGTTTSAGTPTGATKGFTDLASGELCIPDEETAWGDGTDFEHPNWAMYFEYHIQETNPTILVVTRMSQPQSGADRDIILAELTAAGYTDLVSIDEPSGGLTPADIATHNPGVIIYNTWSYPSTSNATPSTLIAWFNSGGNLIINGDDVSRVEAGGGHPYQTPHPTYNNSFGVMGSWEELTRLDYENNGGSSERGMINGYLITLGSGHPVLAGIEGQTFTYYIDPDSTNFLPIMGATSLATATPNSPNPDSFAGGPCITAYDATAGGKGKVVTIGLAFYNGYYVPSGPNTVPAIPSSIAQTLLDNAIIWVSN